MLDLDSSILNSTWFGSDLERFLLQALPPQICDDDKRHLTEYCWIAVFWNEVYCPVEFFCSTKKFDNDVVILCVGIYTVFMQHHIEYLYPLFNKPPWLQADNNERNVSWLGITSDISIILSNGFNSFLPCPWTLQPAILAKVTISFTFISLNTFIGLTMLPHFNHSYISEARTNSLSAKPVLTT